LQRVTPASRIASSFAFVSSRATPATVVDLDVRRGPRAHAPDGLEKLAVLPGVRQTPCEGDRRYLALIAVSRELPAPGAIDRR